jgi:CubicO group peptidase (beta-lactamase class C family)
MTSTTTPRLSGPLTAADAAGAGRSRRIVGGVVFVALWAVASRVLGMGVIGALLLGVVLTIGFQIAVARRPLRALWARDATTFARNRRGKVLVAAVLLGVPAWALLRTIPTWLNDGWAVLLLTAAMVVTYLLLRRLLVSVALAAALVALASALFTPQLAVARTGDRQLLAWLDAQQGMGQLGGYRDLAVARVDLDSPHPVRLAGRGASSTTPMEIGSLTKALSGLVIADSVQRGELSLDRPVDTYLPALAGSPAGRVTLRELVTHTAGYPEFGPAITSHVLWRGPLGRNPLTESPIELLQQARRSNLATRGRYVYSTLGAATAGQAAAAAAGMTYPELMSTRLFAPLGMTDTAIQTVRPLAGRGRTASGLPVQPWVLDGYAPGGGAVSTSRDLARLSTALLDGTAPGLNALTPTSIPTSQDNTHIGNFWQTSTWQTGQAITWHNGQTSGYSSYLGLDRAHHTAVIVLSNVATEHTTDLGTRLLTQRH